MTKKVRNEGQRTIQFGITPEENIRPKEVANLNDATAKKLLALFPGELIDLDNVEVSFDANKVKDFSTDKGKK